MESKPEEEPELWLGKELGRSREERDQGKYGTGLKKKEGRLPGGGDTEPGQGTKGRRLRLRIGRYEKHVEGRRS